MNPCLVSTILGINLKFDAYQCVPFAVTGSINYLYTRLKFDWTEYEYTIYLSTAVIVGTLTQSLLIPLLSLKCKISDIAIGLIGTISGLAKNLVLAFACKWWMMYVGKDN